MTITALLEKWYEENKRDLPWRGTVSPYHIWLSEIILQQTRVSQGLMYYNRFVETYPSVGDLANAPLDEVLKLWQGLGYYTRARNLHATARVIASQYQGEFPGTYKELKKLKGIGTYTAAAIASMAFGEPVALVDGNVYRLLSRLYGIDIPIDTQAGKQVFHDKAGQLLNQASPGTHNQAVMEFGALVCIPKNPDCRHCLLSHLCVAHREHRTTFLPVRAGKTRERERYFHYLFVHDGSNTWLNKRTGKDIWNSLFEFPLIESDRPLSQRDLTSHALWQVLMKGNSTGIAEQRNYRHKLTHQVLHCTFYHARVDQLPADTGLPYLMVPLSRLPEYAVPRIIDRYLADMKPAAYRDK